MQQLEKYLKTYKYPGRGIVIGKNKYNEILLAYFIMGRSANSKNRIFKLDKNKNLITSPFKDENLKNKDLILYTAMTKFKNNIILSNGNHTDTIIEKMNKNENFQDSLKETTYENDPPIFTPRIGAIIKIEEKKQSYIFSIIKRTVKNTTARFFFEFDPIVEGVGHIIHTYKQQGDNLTHSFDLEPVAFEMPNKLNEFTESIWYSLNPEYKISLYSCSINIKTKEQITNILNINE